MCGHYPTFPGLEQNKKAGKGQILSFSLPPSLSRGVHLPPSNNRAPGSLASDYETSHQWPPGSQAFRPNCTTSWLPGVTEWLNVQMTVILCETISLIGVSLSLPAPFLSLLPIYILLILFFWRALTNTIAYVVSNKVRVALTRRFPLLVKYIWGSVRALFLCWLSPEFAEASRQYNEMTDKASWVITF